MRKHRTWKTRKDGVRQRYHVGRKGKKSYGFFWKKDKDKYLSLSDKEYIDQAAYNAPGYKQTYGKVQRISGRRLGAGIAASGVAVPVLIPIPLSAAIGAGVAKKVDNIKLIKTDDQDKPYKIPRVNIELLRKKRNYGMGYFVHEEKPWFKAEQYPYLYGKKKKVQVKERIVLIDKTQPMDQSIHRYLSVSRKKFDRNKYEKRINKLWRKKGYKKIKRYGPVERSLPKKERLIAKGEKG